MKLAFLTGVAGAVVTCAVATLVAQAPAGRQAPAAAQSAATQAAPAAATPAAGDAMRGKAVFLSHQCWACHGYSVETGTRLLLENGSFVARLGNVNTFTNYLRAPRPDQAPPARSLTSMPSYGVTSLTNAQAADLFAYIRSIKPTSPPLAEIPILTQMAGEGGKLKK